MKELLIVGAIGISAILIIYSQKKQQTTVTPVNSITLQQTTSQSTTLNPTTLQPTTLQPTTEKPVITLKPTTEKPVITLKPTLEPTAVHLSKPKDYTNIIIGTSIGGVAAIGVGVKYGYDAKKYYDNRRNNEPELEMHHISEYSLPYLREGDTIQDLNEIRDDKNK